MDSLLKSLVAFNQQVTNITKNAKADRYRYADLAQVLETIRQPLADNQLVLTQTFDELTLVTTLWHVSGQSIESRMAIPSVEGRGMNAAQAMGSAISYARRYALLALLNLATEDDDAVSSSQRTPSNTSAIERNRAHQQPAAPSPPPQVVELVKAHNIAPDVVAGLVRRFGCRYAAEIPADQLDAFCAQLLQLVDGAPTHAA